MFRGLTKRAQKILTLIAQEEAKRFHSEELLPEHVLLAILKEGEGQALQILRKLGVDPAQLKVEIENNVSKTRGSFLLGDVPPSKRCRRVLETAAEEARKLNYEFIGTEHILLSAAGEQGSIISLFLLSKGVSLEKLREAVLGMSFGMSEIARFKDRSGLKPIPAGGRRTSLPHGGKGSTPVLNEFSRDLTEMALSGKIDPVIGREKEINRVIQILARKTKNNPILIGEPGVGKTAIVEGLASRIAFKKTPAILLSKRVMTLDIAAVVAGTKYRGEFEERLKRIMKEIKTDGNIVLFIDEIHTIIGAGGAEGSVDAANMLKPALSRGEIQCIGATTLREYRRHIERDSALERRFQSVLVEEPALDETIEILDGIKKYYEDFHNVTYTSEAIKTAASLSSRYINDRLMPDKAIDILDEAGAQKRLAVVKKPKELEALEKQLEQLIAEKQAHINNQDYEKAIPVRDKINVMRSQKDELETRWRESIKLKHNLITEGDIFKVISEITGIPVTRIAENESEKLLKLEEYLHKTVIGQDEAIKVVASSIRRRRAGISSHKRPLGSFIFLGPTGVGKTLLAKTLAGFLFGSQDALVRIDMSDYMEKHNASRLVGSPPGYIGYDEGGVLTEKVRRKPYCVVLFDEIEKAHPDVFNLLLQILEEGEIQDNLGHRVSFRNAVIVMTSNAGARDISSGFPLGFKQSETITSEEIKAAALNELKRLFRPEFLNRVDDIVVFESLTKEHMSKIFDGMAAELKERLSEKSIRIRITAAAKQQMVETGLDPRYGARPLRRVIQSSVEDELSTLVIKGIVTESSTAVVDIKDGQIVIYKEEGAEVLPLQA